MKNQLLHSAASWCVVLLLSSAFSYGQKTTFPLNENESAFVMIQLKEQKGQSPGALSEPDVLEVVNQIKIINTKLGYEEFAKKMASFTLDTMGHKTTYLTIRNFNDFTSAEEYGRALYPELNKDIYGKIKAPFPISQSDYKRCVAAKSFESYYKYYSRNRK
ncbi:MAG: hypothetical protein KBA14_01770 [Saprospiraceae bacterium]|nr:hypothetical protein [Saprospiraceae bacterium]